MARAIIQLFEKQAWVGTEENENEDNRTGWLVLNHIEPLDRERNKMKQLTNHQNQVWRPENFFRSFQKALFPKVKEQKKWKTKLWI